MAADLLGFAGYIGLFKRILDYLCADGFFYRTSIKRLIRKDEKLQGEQMLKKSKIDLSLENDFFCKGTFFTKIVSKNEGC
ncbi:hypothetical protein [Bartonella heixiaziensis]|uniref:hypothetical protein n=1 Tax=Bartonella heixiaziensis TaxID=1461000 RepID=UPI003D2279AD